MGTPRTIYGAIDERLPMTTPAWLQAAVNLAGAGQLVIVVGSLAIPAVLKWKADVAKLRPLTRQVFWTYAAYIWATNLCFGLISVVGAPLLIEGTPLSAAVTGFITLYWAARIVIQFAYFDRSDAPSGAFFVFAEIVLVGLFLFFTAIYGYATFVNVSNAGVS